MHHPRSLTFAVACLLSALVLGLVGCRLLRINQIAPPEPPRPREAQPELPGKVQFRISQYVFHADFEVNRNLPIFQELSQLREQVHRELQLPPSTNLVKVYLFEDRQRYERFMQGRYPDLPKRRAFFIAQPLVLGGAEELQVYTYWGDRVSQDLRHELTHALLHSVLRDVPLWLDEGLAEYFELPPGAAGVNFQHVNHLRQGGGPFRPDLARLEGLTEVQQMTPAEYREAWAWVHWMLRGSPESRRVLIGYLHELRNSPEAGRLRPRLLAVLPNADEAVVAHVASLDAAQQRPVASGQ